MYVNVLLSNLTITHKLLPVKIGMQPSNSPSQNQCALTFKNLQQILPFWKVGINLSFFKQLMLNK